MRLSQQSPKGEKRPANDKGGSGDSIDPSKPARSSRIGLTPRLGWTSTAAPQDPPLAQNPPIESHRASLFGRPKPTGRFHVI
jgi:hypothetical protein